MEVNGQLHTTATVPAGKGSLVSIGKEIGWASEFVLMLRLRK
jgi:hypothetical protein